MSLLFFLFAHMNEYSFSCALIYWFDHIADEPNYMTKIWMVSLSFIGKSKNFAVIQLDAVT